MSAKVRPYGRPVVYCSMSDKRRLVPVLVGVAGASVVLALVVRPHPPKPLPKPPTPQTAPARQEAGPLGGVVVVLDPGHGGADSGTVCGGLSEAALTYRTAAEVAAALRASGATVVYTVRSRTLAPSVAVIEPPPERPADAVLEADGEPLRSRRSPRPLWERAATARRVWAGRVKADPDAARDVFFLSLHFDEFHAPGVAGAVVCVDRRVSRVPVLARALAWEMAGGHFERRSDFRGIAGLSGRDLGVLDPVYNPVPERALLELATLSNGQDALEAGDPVWRGEMARRIVEAITFVHQRHPTGSP